MSDADYAKMAASKEQPVNWVDSDKQVVSSHVYDVATQHNYCAASYAIVVAEAVSALKAQMQGNFVELSPQ